MRHVSRPRRVRVTLLEAAQGLDPKAHTCKLAKQKQKQNKEKMHTDTHKLNTQLNTIEIKQFKLVQV